MPKNGDVREDGFVWLSGQWHSREAIQRRNKRKRDKRKADPAYREKINSRNRERDRERWRSDLEFRARQQVSDRRKEAKERGLDTSGLEGEHREELVRIICNGSSILSGIPFVKGRGAAQWNSPSIDQKEAGKGYPWENIRVVLHAENNAMGNWGKETMFYVFAMCLLKEAQKRGSTADCLSVLQAIANCYKPEELRGDL